MPITKEQFDQVQAANPGVEIEILQHDRLPDEVIARVPLRKDYRTYQALQNDGNFQKANADLVAASVLFTGGKSLQQLATHVADAGDDPLAGKLEEIRAANHGVEIWLLRHDKLPDRVIARTPAPAIWTIYRNLQAEGKKLDAREALVGASILYPAKKELEASFDAHPALVEVWTGELVEAAGALGSARRKKF